MTETTRGFSVVPTVIYKDADAALDFLTRAFAFKEHAVYRDETGKVVHAELIFGNGMIMIGSDPGGEFGQMVMTLRSVWVAGARKQSTSSWMMPTRITRRRKRPVPKSSSHLEMKVMAAETMPRAIRKDMRGASGHTILVLWRRQVDRVLIRPFKNDDARNVWAMLEPVIRAGETYALPRDMPKAAALTYWTGPDRETFVVEIDGELAGTYYLKANHAGGGAHVANCGYVTDAKFAGRGVARAMCDHSLELARERGFRAMQFNFVISTNTTAVRLWEKLGFKIVGRLPRAFAHPREGDVDAFVMHRFL